MNRHGPTKTTCNRLSRNCIALLLSLVFCAWPSLVTAEEVGCKLDVGAPDPCTGDLLTSVRFVIDRPFLDAFNTAAGVVQQLELDLEECEERAAKSEAEERDGPGWGTVAGFGTSMAAIGFAIGLFVGAGL
jgi:hypothetical protein